MAEGKKELNIDETTQLLKKLEAAKKQGKTLSSEEKQEVVNAIDNILEQGEYITDIEQKTEELRLHTKAFATKRKTLYWDNFFKCPGSSDDSTDDDDDDQHQSCCTIS